MSRRKYRKLKNLFSIKLKGSIKNRKEITATILYKLQFIDSARFMASSSSNFADNLAEWIQKVKSKYGNGNEKCEKRGIKCKDCERYLECTNVKNDLI